MQYDSHPGGNRKLYLIAIVFEIPILLYLNTIVRYVPQYVFEYKSIEVFEMRILSSCVSCLLPYGWLSDSQTCSRGKRNFHLAQRLQSLGKKCY